MTFFMPRKIRLIRVRIVIRIIILFCYHSVLAYRFKHALGFFIFILRQRFPFDSPFAVFIFGSRVQAVPIITIQGENRLLCKEESQSLSDSFCKDSIFPNHHLSRS